MIMFAMLHLILFLVTIKFSISWNENKSSQISYDMGEQTRQIFLNS